MKIERILTGIDFGSATESIIGYSSFFAESMHASLNLFYVIDYLITPPAYLAPYMEKEKEIAEKRFALLKKRLMDTGTKVETEVTVGRLHESFDMAVKKTNTDMLILGFISHALRRSSSEKLIKGLQMPILVVRGEKAESVRIGSVKIRRILCPTDFSEASKKALKVANELKDNFSAELEVIHVLPSHIIKRRIKKLSDRDKIIQKLFEEAKDNFYRFLNDSSLKKTEVIEEGKPDGKIVSFSKENDIDLIVMGARGLGFIKGIFIGSVTDAVLKSSPCPVLIIH